MFVQGFHHGDVAPLRGGTAAFHAVFGPHIDRAEPEQHFWHVTTPDGGRAGIYADNESFDSIMLTHFSFGEVMDLLAEFAKRTNAVIMPVGCPTLLVSSDQREHLPQDLLDAQPAVVIVNGHDIAEAIRTA